MGRCQGVARKIGWDEVSAYPAEWDIYKKLIEGIPEDVMVKDYVVGNHWVYLEAESGPGMAMAVSGGSGAFGLGNMPLHMSLRDVACQVTSWNNMEASVGVAAMNAWYSAPQNAAAFGMKIEEKGTNDGFDLYRSICAGKKVTVVGHFPLIERLAPECTLTVLERMPSGSDVPDPGCEYIIPHQDFTFITGITITNKTFPRLLQLVKNGGGSAIMVGPSVVPAPVLYEYGVDCMAGSVIVDPERAKAAILRGSTSGIFDAGVQKMRVERPGWLEGLGVR